MTANSKRNTEQNIQSSDQSHDARWKDDYSAARSGITLFDLFDAENVRARQIAQAVDMNDIQAAQQFSSKEAPLRLINELMKQANLAIEIEVQSGEQITARKNGGEPFSIAQLSDGERNALLIAASVLTAKPGCLILVDEPERHLHRSIISPLLTQLFAKRPDCGFVVSTHDIGLPLDNKSTQTILVRSCIYSGLYPQSWDAEIVPPEGGVDEDVRIEILGSRKKILFVEGKGRSLDYPLYSLMFPEVSVIPKESCKDVERFVESIREAAPLHWVSAWGIVDGDGRVPEDRARLRRKGVFALSNYSVEAIYYHPDMMRCMAERQAALTGDNADEMMQAALSSVVTSLVPHKIRLSARVAENEVRSEIFKHLPTLQSITARNAVSISVDVDAIVQREVTRFEHALTGQDVIGLMGRYPIRDTPALDEAVRCLKFKDKATYERSVRKLISDDSDALANVRSLFSDLIEDMSNQSGTTAVSVT